MAWDTHLHVEGTKVRRHVGRGRERLRGQRRVAWGEKRPIEDEFWVGSGGLDRNLLILVKFVVCNITTELLGVLVESVSLAFWAR